MPFNFLKLFSFNIRIFQLVPKLSRETEFGKFLFTNII